MACHMPFDETDQKQEEWDCFFVYFVCSSVNSHPSVISHPNHKPAIDLIYGSFETYCMNHCCWKRTKGSIKHSEKTWVMPTCLFFMVHLSSFFSLSFIRLIRDNKFILLECFSLERQHEEEPQPCLQSSLLPFYPPSGRLRTLYTSTKKAEPTEQPVSGPREKFRMCRHCILTSPLHLLIRIWGYSPTVSQNEENTWMCSEMSEKVTKTFKWFSTENLHRHSEKSSF